jgi:ribosomal protein S18 acetylase RimI-like enzyme
MSGLPHALRPFTESDRHFIARGWVSEMRRSGFARHVPQNVYWPCQHELVRQLLERAHTIVACDPEDPQHVYGCIVVQAEAPVIHWLYVKGSYRRVGLATALVTATFGDRRPLFCTQAPELFRDRELIERHEVIYCPYLLLGIAPQLPDRAPREAA